tara:strand:- start:3908 stop:8173 length:4266 start_codon:yes stop_codon:yes gene_type:complete
MNLDYISKTFKKLVYEFPAVIASATTMSGGEFGTSAFLLCMGAVGLLTKEIIDDVQQGKDIDTIREHVKEALEVLKQQQEGTQLVADLIAIEKDIEVNHLGFDKSRSPYLIIHRFIQGEFDTLTEEVQSILTSQADLHVEMSENKKRQLQLLSVCKEIANSNIVIEEIEYLLDESISAQKELLATIISNSSEFAAYFDLTLDELSKISQQYNNILHQIQIQKKTQLPLAFELYPYEMREENSDTQKLFRFHYRNRRLGLIGRERERKELLHFLETDSSKTLDLKWWLWTGPAGLGKSRLALELCLDAHAKGFHAGFLPVNSTGTLGNEDFQQPHLIILDYTVHRADVASKLIMELKNRESYINSPIRILILERAVEKEFEHYLQSTKSIATDSDSLLIDSFKYKDTQILKPLTNDDLWQIMSLIFKEHERNFQNQRKEILEILYSIDPQKRPLFAMMAAESLCSDTPNQLEEMQNWDQTILSERIFGREIIRWRAVNIDDKILNNVFFSTIAGAQSFDSFNVLNQLIESETHLLIPGEELEKKDLKQIFSYSQSVDEDIIHPFEPDLLGEYFVLERLIGHLRIDEKKTKKTKNEAYELLYLAWCRFPSQTSSFLLRASQDFSSHQAKQEIAKLSIEQFNHDLDSSLLLPLIIRGFSFYLFDLNNEAISDYTLVIQHPDASTVQFTTALIYRALVHDECGKTVEAISDYTQVINLLVAPVEDVALALLNRGNAYGNQQNILDAVSDWTRVVEFPDAPVEYITSALHNRGLAHKKEGKLVEAITDWTQLIEIPDAPVENVAQALCNRGIIYEEQRRIAESFTDWSRVMELPDVPVEYVARVLLNRGVANDKQGKFIEAIADWTQLIDLPDAPVEEVAIALLNRSITHDEQGSLLEADADRTQLIELPDASAEYVAPALLNRGVAHDKQDKLVEAIEDFTQLIKLPDAPVEYVALALQNRGVVHDKQDNLVDAIADWTQLIELPDASIEHVVRALLNRGIAYGEQDKFEEAIADWSQLIEIPDASIEHVVHALLNRGSAHDKQGFFAEAIADWTHVIELPDAPVEEVARALYNRGITHDKQGKPTETIADYTQLIDLQDAPVKHVASALLNRGATHDEQGNLVEAIADWTQLIELPNAPAEDVISALFNRSNAYGEENKFEDAIADWTQLIELPDAPVEEVARALYNRGVTHDERGKRFVAIADWTQVIELPDAPVEDVSRALLNRGIAYGEQNKIDEAIADWTQLIELPGVPVVYVSSALLNRGIKYGEQDKFDEAVADWTQLIQLSDAPVEEVARALLNRGIAYGEQDKFVEAVSDWTQLIQLSDVPVEEVAWALLYRGNTYGNQDNILDAVADWTKLIELPDVPIEYVSRALLYRGIAHEKQGKLEDAKIDLRRNLSINGITEELKELTFEILNRLEIKEN